MQISRKQFYICIFCLLLSILIFVITTNDRSDGVSIVYRLVGILLFYYCLVRGGREETIFNPYYLFAFVPLSLSIYSANVSTFYLKDLTSSTWSVALTNIFAFLFGLRMVSRKRPNDIFSDVSKQETSRGLVNDAIILFILGRVPNIYEMVTGSNFFLASVVQWFSYAAIVCAMKSKSKKTISILSILLIGSMFAGASINKTSILFISMTYLLSYSSYYVENERQKRKLFFVLIVLAFLFIFVFFPLKDYTSSGGGISGFFSSDFTATFSYYESRSNWSGNKLLFMPYMYFVQAWNNLQYVIETQNTRTFGLWLFKPLLGYLQIDKYFEQLYSLTPYSSFNTYTYITVLFKDFGYYFSWIGSLILGAFVGWVYKHKYLLSNSAFDLVCYSLTACATFEMFFSNHFLMQSYPFTIIIIMWMYRLLRNTLKY